MKTAWLAAVIGIGLLTACGRDSVPPDYVPDGDAYFPLVTGHSVTYAVDSIVLDDAPGGNTKDTIRFQIREEIADRFVGATGDTLFVVHRYRRGSPQDAWSLQDVWTAGIVGGEALRREENLTFLKFPIPFLVNSRWNTTAYIFSGATVQVGTEFLQPYTFWDARLDAVDVSGEVGALSFADGSLMHIRHVDTDDGLTRRFVRETYARGIGLVERVDTILDSRCIELGDFGPCLGKPWLQHAGKGYMLRQTLIDYP